MSIDSLYAEKYMILSKKFRFEVYGKMHVKSLQNFQAKMGQKVVKILPSVLDPLYSDQNHKRTTSEISESSNEIP